ncbi:MAG: hypothetical protein Q4B03_07065 [Lachnospiraceae bacterium]|nr:hypothetical protein [Lachnospiraceae bacterium]
MDKTEYQLKLNEITDCVQNREYGAALKIVEEIDWKRVKSIRTLSMVADIYEVNRDYRNCKRILLLAYEKTSIGKNLLFRLTEISLKLKEMEDAEKFYKQYLEVAPNDNARHLLKYKLLKAKDAPIEERIRVLETYKEYEYTERWAYELAELYHKAGMDKECIDACDDMILWFSEGRYVLKAMELKKQHEALAPYQQRLYEKASAEKVKEEPKIVLPVATKAAVEANFAKAERVDSKMVLKKMDEAGAAITRDVVVDNRERTNPLTDAAIDQYSVTSKEFIGKTANLSLELEKSIRTVFANQNKEEQPVFPDAEDLTEDLTEDIFEEESAEAEPEKAEEAKVEAESDKAESAEAAEEPEKAAEAETEAESEKVQSAESENDIEPEKAAEAEIEPENTSEADPVEAAEAEAETKSDEAAEAEAETKSDEVAEAETEVKPDEAAEAKTDTEPEADAAADRKREKTPEEAEAERIAMYNLELEIPDPVPSEEDRKTHTIPLSKLGQNTVPISIEDVIRQETPEERRIRILNDAKPTRMNDDQRKIFTYFARIPGMDKQILSALSGVYKYAGEHTSRQGNIAIMGARGTGKTRLTQGLLSNMCKDMGLEAAKVARVKGYILNKRDIPALVRKMSGGFLIIEDAGEMNTETIEKLNQAMEFRTDCMIIIMEAPKAEMRALLKENPAFAEKFNARINIPAFTNDELVTFARTYCEENNCQMDELGVLALYSLISNNQSEDEPVTIADVKKMVDSAILHAQSSGKRFGRGRRNRNKQTILYEKDFDLV